MSPVSIYYLYLAQCDKLEVNPSIIGWCAYFDAWNDGVVAGRMPHRVIIDQGAAI